MRRFAKILLALLCALGTGFLPVQAEERELDEPSLVPVSLQVQGEGEILSEEQSFPAGDYQLELPAQCELHWQGPCPVLQLNEQEMAPEDEAFVLELEAGDSIAARFEDVLPAEEEAEILTEAEEAEESAALPPLLQARAAGSTFLVARTAGERWARDDNPDQGIAYAEFHVKDLLGSGQDWYQGFCCDSNLKDPDTSTVYTNWGEYKGAHRSMLVRALYYGFGGPADRLSDTYGGTAANIITNDLCSLIWTEGDHSHCKTLLDGWFYENYTRQELEKLKTLPEPDADYHIYLIESGQKNQPIVFGTYEDTAGLYLEKTDALKDAGCRQLTQGNKAYSLAGAEYEVYAAADYEAHKNEADLSKYAAGRLVTSDDKGTGKSRSNTLWLKSGTYKVIEVKASPGYVLDTQVHTITLDAKQQKQEGLGRIGIALKVQEQPAYAVPGLVLTKTDPQGQPLAGAEFRLTWTVKDGASLNGIFKTDGNGQLLFDQDHGVNLTKKFISSIPKLPDGTWVLGIGTLEIQETKAPAGYQLEGTVYTFSIDPPDSHSSSPVLELYNKPLTVTNRSYPRLPQTGSPLSVLVSAASLLLSGLWLRRRF